MVTLQNLKNLGKKLSVQHNILKILLEEDEKKGHEKLLEEIIAENVPKNKIRRIENSTRPMKI